MAEMMTISKAEWKRMNERLEALEAQRTAIYEAVKATLEFKSLDEINEDNYKYAVNIFEAQKPFFKRRNFPEGVITHERKN